MPEKLTYCFRTLLASGLGPCYDYGTLGRAEEERPLVVSGGRRSGELPHGGVIATCGAEEAKEGTRRFRREVRRKCRQ